MNALLPCQLCGKSSWAALPENHSALPPGVSVFLWGKVFSEYRQCEECGSCAAVAQLEVSVEPPPPVDKRHVIDVSGVIDHLLPVLTLLSAPETRMERLVSAVLNSQHEPEWCTIKDRASYAVKLAREIEKELDSPTLEPAQIVTSAQISLSWASRQTFEDWLSRGLEAALNRGGGGSAGTVSKHFADWMEGK